MRDSHLLATLRCYDEVRHSQDVVIVRIVVAVIEHSLGGLSQVSLRVHDDGLVVEARVTHAQGLHDVDRELFKDVLVRSLHLLWPLLRIRVLGRPASLRS